MRHRVGKATEDVQVVFPDRNLAPETGAHHGVDPVRTDHDVGSGFAVPEVSHDQFVVSLVDTTQRCLFAHP